MTPATSSRPKTPAPTDHHTGPAPGLALRSGLGVLACLTASLLMPLPALAQTAQQPAADPGVQVLADQAQHWIEGNLAQLALAPTAGAAPLRMEIKVGTLDPRLRLAPCGQPDVYLPTGTRLWGRARIGIRCLDGVARWNVFLPVTVKAFGKAWVANRTIQPGEVLRAEDAREATVDWAEEASPVLADAATWVGAQSTRLLMPGQALRAAGIKEQTAFVAGSTVKVLAQGGGFQVTTEGQALTPGSIGRTARVRAASGRVFSGTVLDENTVKVDL